MREWLGLIALGVALSMSACATSRDESDIGAEATAPCRQETPDTFVLTGPTDAVLAACVAANFQSTTRTLVLNSPGGDVASALDIAAHFEGRRLRMRVRRQCNSSCGNYFLPLAGDIELEPGTLVILHGSIDPWTMDRALKARVETWRAEGLAQAEIDRRLARGTVSSRALVDRQSAFAARNGVHPGWLLYREPGSDNASSIDDLPDGGRFLLVEEPMMRSCLSARITPYQADLERRWLRSHRRLGLMWTGTRPSGAAACEPVV